MTRRGPHRARGRWLALLACGLAASACAPQPLGGAGELAGLVPFVWPRDGVVHALACRFDTARPIGVALEGATREEETAAAAALRAWQRAGLGVRFLDAPREHAQLVLAFADEPLAEAARAVVDCRVQGEAAEIARARVEVGRGVRDARGAARALARDELLGLIAREVGRALGWTGAARAGDPVRVAALRDAARTGAAIRAGRALVSPALAALYAQPAGLRLASAPAQPPEATRPIDRLAALAGANGLDGPYLRTSAAAGRVFWRDPATGDEYGAQVLAPGRALRALGRVAIALEARARRALPRSRDAAPAPPPDSPPAAR